MRPARFITLDGLDGSGKTSQQALLAAWLRGRGIDVVTCRDPGSTPAGDAVRAILLDRHDLALAPATEMLLYMAARAQLVAEVVRPALARGAWVVADRFLLANVVYQGHAGGLGRDTVLAVGAIATGGLAPDLTIVLDVDLATAAVRLDRPLDRLEQRGDEYRRRVREGYLTEARAAPDHVVVVDGAASAAAVAERIIAEVVRRFPEA
jgi:dTMP kinase